MSFQDNSSTRKCYQLDFLTIFKQLNNSVDIYSKVDKKTLILNELYNILNHDETYDYDTLAAEFYEELYEYSILTKLMKMGDDEKLTDIFVDEYNDIYYFDLKGNTVETQLSFFNANHLKMFIDKFVDFSNSSLNKSNLTLETTLSNNARLTVQHKSINLNGYAFTIRFKKREIFDGNFYVNNGSCTSDMISFYRWATSIGCKIMIHGVTGAGKTTLLESLITFYPKDKYNRSFHRHAFISDSETLRLKKREPSLRITEINSIDKSDIQYTLTDAVKNALRMNIKKLHFNEIRGIELVQVFDGWTTGLDGITGCFGENIHETWNGIINKLMLGNPSANLRDVSQIAFKAVDLFIECKQIENRKIHNKIRQLVSLDDDFNPVFETLFEYDADSAAFISHIDHITFSDKIKSKHSFKPFSPEEFL